MLPVGEERRRGPTSAPLERSEESGTARHSLRAPAGSIYVGSALPSLSRFPCGIGIWRRRRLGFWLAAPRAADGGGGAGARARQRTGGGTASLGFTSGDRGGGREFG